MAWLLAAALLFLSPALAFAQSGEPIKIGMAGGMTGYLASIDRGWRDGVAVAVEKLNKEGGALGRKLELLVEDNRSEPQPTVTAVNKLIVSDKAAVILNGCSSAGNAASAPVAMRGAVPLIIGGVYPADMKPEEKRWIFSMFPPPPFEVLPRFEYLQKKTPLRKVGVLYDPTPYANLQKKIAEGDAGKYGLTIVGVEQYKANDTDLSAQISKLKAAGAEAIVKMGAGPSTITAAKNMRQLGLRLPLLASVEDLAVFKQAAEALGDEFFFVANPPQVYEAVPEGPTRHAIKVFLEAWQARHGDRDPTWGGRGWDALHVVVEAMKKAGTTDGAKVRDALESVAGYNGTNGVYTFSPDSHYGIRENPIVLAHIVGGKVTILK
jgi:ABC-type branched-subunit amino acid transport system substrate-binding protein